MIYRQAVLSDVDEITKIHQQYFPNESSNIENQIESLNYRIYVAVQKEIIGYIIFQFVANEAEVYFFAVKSEFRNSQIGSKLLHFAIESLKTEKVNKITLEVRVSNQVARQVYEKANFKEVGLRKKYYIDNLEDAIVYSWEG